MRPSFRRHLDEQVMKRFNMGKPAKAKRGIPSKVEDFNAWYPFIVEAAELVDKRYPIKGMDVWRPAMVESYASNRCANPCRNGANRS